MEGGKEEEEGEGETYLVARSGSGLLVGCRPSPRGCVGRSPTRLFFL